MKICINVTNLFKAVLIFISIVLFFAAFIEALKFHPPYGGITAFSFMFIGLIYFALEELGDKD